jgi:soluble lytic murein transglycosylase-like protein
MAALAAPLAASASQAVLADGRVLRVTAVRPLGETAWLLDLEGGGQISCARSRLVEVRPDPPPLIEETEPPGWEKLAGPYGDIIDQLAAEIGVDVRLVVAVVQAESNFDPLALSVDGAQGLMQLMPGTAADLAVQDPFDPEQNLRGGIRYLNVMIERFAGDLELALAAYNAGPEVVARYGGVPPYPETRDYVRRVMRTYERL